MELNLESEQKKDKQLKSAASEKSMEHHNFGSISSQKLSQ